MSVIWTILGYIFGWGILIGMALIPILVFICVLLDICGAKNKDGIKYSDMNYW